MEIPTDILPFFQSAGWYPERRVALPNKAQSLIPEGHPAAMILSTFSGLRVGRVGLGEECAASDIIFGLIEDSEDAVGKWNDLLKTKLIGVAEYHHSHGELFIDAVGKCYSLGLQDTFCFEGDNFNQAARNLLLGRRSRPMLLPGEESVMVYGEIYTAESPEVYRY
ncbi:SUKH-3 domain-containing protein [Nodosilinea sp. FACHB-13]|uniref:SUKH-3 domain-containing protein n=1 Tax=Leptolyngbya subtilissima TaxID=1346803 RepID=UPI0016873E11|nr:SUKH-3 domain-containing protein [Nodosilinea sp. FACHB-13]